MRGVLRVLPTWAVAAAALLGCTDQTAPGSPAPLVRTVTVDTSDAGAILLHVTLDGPGAVQVEYWRDPQRKLRLLVRETTNTVSIFLPRLDAGQTYQYIVSGLRADGGESRALGGSLVAPSLPDDLAQLSFAVSGGSTQPITMLEVVSTFHGFVAVDRGGQIVWWWRTVGIPQGMTRRENGNFVLNDAGYRLVEVSPAGDIIHELSTDVRQALPSHHDVTATPANTLLFLAGDTRTVSDSTLVGDAIWEWTPETNRLVKRWTTFDFYDPSRDVGTRSTAMDWVHANSLALGDHGNVILSMNWLDQIISIAPDWESIEWKLGGRGSTVAVDAGAAFQGQHTASVLPNGHVLLFDNGRDRAAPQAYSRGLELVMDASARVARRVWEFRTTPDSYAPYVGSARRLISGNTMVFFGLATGFVGATGPLAGYEVRPDGAVVWRLLVNGASVVYRGTPLSSIGGETDVP